MRGRVWFNHFQSPAARRRASDSQCSGTIERLESRRLLTASMTSPAELASLETSSLIVPAYSSLPGADATLYLNFAGDPITSWLGYSNVTVPVWSIDADRTQFSAVELDEIEETWRGVAEDFAPFNINVTTVDPLSVPTDLPIHVTKVNIGWDGSWYGAAGASFS